MDSKPASPRIAVLGPVLVEDRTGALVEPAGALGKSLIVALVLARGSLSVRSLVSELWDDAPPRQERAALQTLVSRVRTASADGLLESTPTGYALAIDPQLTDLGLARIHLERASQADADGDAATAAENASRALALWRGEPGVELGSIPLADELGRAASALRDELLLIRARSHRMLGDPSAALRDLESLTAVAPLDEAVQLERLRALDAAGRRNDAVRAFGELKEAMLDQLGTRPGAALVAFNAALLLDDEREHEREHEREAGESPRRAPAEHDRAARNDVPPPAPTRLRAGLRAAPNTLIGREYDLDALEDLIATSRLTTVLGAGGLGKTRLAQEVGNRAVHTPAVVFVELASVRSGDDIALAFASTLGIREARALRPGDPGAQLDLRSRILGVLSERETLLIVDNCEHIVDDAAAWIADILESTTTVRVLATSRAPLAIGAERVYPLDSLASVDGPGTDGAGSAGPAVALFVERARAARPAVVLPPDAVARLCDRLDGLPLAIELAAARTRSMSVEEIERRLGNRFALLTSGDRTAPERHRTLLAVIDWSWNLLGGSERALLRRLSQFPDGFSATAAEVVAGDGADTVLDDLDALVNQSLVSVAEDPSTGILRYRMLETVREFGDLALVEAGETQLVRDGMYRWAQQFSRETLARLHGVEQVPSFNLITAEQDNLVTILRAAIDDRRSGVIVSVFSALAYYWSLRGAHTEVLAFGPIVVGALTGWEPRPDERQDAAAAYAVVGATFLYAGIRTAVRAISRLKRIKRDGPLDDPRLEALTNLVQLAGREGPGMALLTQYRESSDPQLAAIGNLITAQFLENEGDLDGALSRSTAAYEKSILSQDTWGTASAAQSIAQVHSQLARPAETLLWARRAQDGMTKLQASGDLHQLDWLIAINSITQGDVGTGRELLERYLREENDSTGFEYVDYYGIGHGGLAEIALAEGDLAEGILQYREAVAVFIEHNSVTNPWLTILGAASLVTRLRALPVRPDLVGWSGIDELARDLRTRILVNHRLQASYLDKPVLGAGFLGVARWMLAERDDVVRDAAWLRSGRELFAIAERVNARQDLHTLDRARSAAEIRAAWGEDVLDGARAAAQALDRNDAALRGLALLKELRF